MTRVRSVLICHAEEPLHADGVSRWLNSRTDLAGIVRIREPRRAFLRRIRREWKRSGAMGLANVAAFRAAYALGRRRQDAAWRQTMLSRMADMWPAVPSSVPVIEVESANSAESEAFIRRCAPDVALALCKQILAPRVFEIPRMGTFVCHPGIAPEYRNAHGCYWAIASDDLDRVGMTMLRIDRGVDTGPIYGYFTCDFDPARESHIVIQHRVLLENLDGVAAILESIAAGTASPISTEGRGSGVWGQPTLTSFLRMRRRMRRQNARAHALSRA